MKVYLESISFNDGTPIKLNDSDIIIFTGSNNSGKSQVLRDIKNHFAKDSHPIVVKSITPKIDQPDIFTTNAIKINADYCSYDGYELYGKPENLLQSNSDYVLKIIHPTFISHLSTEHRLSSSMPAESIDITKDKPIKALHKLYSDDSKEAQISEYFKQAFGISCIINRGAGRIIPVHIGEQPSKGEGEDRVSKRYLEQLKSLPQIQTQGDGMRSFLGILLEVFSGDQSIVLLDEPEAFLHPPQARLLGKILTQNTPKGRQLFLSTHSEDFLKGLLESGDDRIKIIRLNRVGDTNHVSILDNNKIKEVWQAPILRYSNVFSGLFHSKVVICESDADCRFYQAMVDVVAKEENLNTSADILFVQCGGKHRLSTLSEALRALNVKVAIIADIDLLSDKKTFEEVSGSLGISWDDNLKRHWDEICKYMKDQKPSLSKSQIKAKINTMLDKIENEELCEKDAKSIIKEIKPTTAWHEVKKMGISFFPNGQPHNSINGIISICNEKGLFILKCGELECFCRSISGHGPAWVNKVLEEKDLKQDPDLRDAREFAKAILKY